MLLCTYSVLLAGELGYELRHIARFELLSGPNGNTPSENLMNEYGHRHPTVDELYFKLKQLHLHKVASCIQHLGISFSKVPDYYFVLVYFQLKRVL